MSLQVLGHGEALDLLLAENLGHLGIGSEETLVLRILEIVLLQIGPEPLGNLKWDLSIVGK